MLTGTIGALEATVELDREVEDFAELERAWAKLATIEAHKQWSKDPGTAQCSAYRIVNPTDGRPSGIGSLCRQPRQQINADRPR